MPELLLAVAGGGLTTEAVAMDERARLLAKAQIETGPGLSEKLDGARRRLLTGGRLEPGRVTRVMLGVEHIIGEALDRGTVGRVATIRLGSPFTLAVPPLALWPGRLSAAISAGVVVVAGGAEYDGRTAASLDEDAIARFVAPRAEDLDAVALTGMFSSVAPGQELAAAEVVRRELGPGIDISLSHELGPVGLIERENSTILNAALAKPARELAGLIDQAMRAAGISADSFVARYDGAMMALDFAHRFPVLMLGSGPASVMRGVAHLTDIDGAVIVHAQRHATEVGAVIHGSAPEGPSSAEVAGVRIGRRWPDVQRLGPHPETTALTQAVERARAIVPAAPVIAAGGARSALPDELPGIGRIVHPVDADVAWAVGVATGQVSGQADRICADRPDHRQNALGAARDAAVAQAVLAGADPDALDLVEVREWPLIKDVNPAVRIRVKVAGPPI
jgi:N-methylhydantoinase A/oxoprolinase/acetone carboxylase beta subunit